MEKGNRRLKKNFIWNTIGALFNSFTSLFFMIIITRINGVDSAGIFTFAFSTACLFQAIGTYAGRVYQVTENNKKITDNDYIYNRFATCLIMLLVGFVFSFIKGYSGYKISIIMILVLFKAIESFSDSIYGIIQKSNMLYKVGFSLFIKGIFGLLAFLVVDFFTKDIILSSFALIIVNLFIIFIYDYFNIKKCKFMFAKPNLNGIKLIFTFGFYTFFFNFLNQYLINASKYSIDSYLSSKYQTIFAIIIMPATIIALAAQFLVAPFLIQLKDKLKKGDYNKFNKQVKKIVLYLSGIGLVAIFIAFILGIPFLELIYGIELEQYLIHLLIIILGAVFYGLSYILSSALTTLRSTFSQAIVYIITSIFAFIISEILVKNIGLLGATISYGLSMLLLLLLYFIIYTIKMRKLKRINS